MTTNQVPILCVIPARGGSKGLPRKNLMPLCGEPLIAWTIKTACACRGISYVIVTTDDDEIADAARAAGAEVPFVRPAELATDQASMIDTLIHAVQTFESMTDHIFPIVVLLQPTDPLRTTHEIESAIKLLHESGGDSVITVHAVDSGHPHYMYELDGDRATPMFPPPPGVSRRQDFKPAFIRNGSVYAVRRDVLIQQRSLYGRDVRAIITDPMTSINIDTRLDFEFAAFLMAKKLDHA